MNFASPLIDLSIQRYKDIAYEDIQAKAINVINCFYHKEMEEMAEYICVWFLYENHDSFKQLVFNEKRSRQDQNYKPYTKIISNKIKGIVKGAIGNDDPNNIPDVEDPCEVYKLPEQNLAYRDATQLVNQKMATGDLQGRRRQMRSTKRLFERNQWSQRSS